MWKLTGKPKTVAATKTLATEYAEMTACPHDRELRERRLMVYRKIRAEGKFRPVTWARAWCKETGEWYRVNGKHTAVMLASEPAEMPEFYVTLEDYECETMEDVARLYGTFDSALQSRTAREIYQSFAGTVPELSGIPTQVIWAVPPGVAYARLGADVYLKSQPVERAEYLLEHTDFVRWFAKLIRGGAHVEGRGGHWRCPHLIRQPVVAAMFNGWERSQKACHEFWTLVRDETAKTECPTRKLARYLVLAEMRPGDKHRHYRKPTGLRELYVKCLHAWNAWRSGETTNLNYYPNAKVPVAR